MLTGYTVRLASVDEDSVFNVRMIWVFYIDPELVPGKQTGINKIQGVLTA